MALKKNKFLVGLFLALFCFSTLANAIIPFVVQGAIALAPTVARIAVGQFAAAGLATVINPTTTKTLSIPKGSRALKVSFGAASAIAALALFAGASGYVDSSSSVCVSWGGSSTKQTIPEIEAYYNSLSRPSGTFVSSSASKIGITDGTSWFWLFDWCRVWGTPVVTPAADVAWLDLSTNITQSKTDKLVTDLKAFAVSNPTDFDQIVQMSDFASSQPDMLYDTASGVVTVSSDGAGSVSVSGGSNPALTLDANNQVLVDGLPPTAPASPSTASPTPPSGTASATGSDLGAVVQAVNASKAQSTLDSKGIVDALTYGLTDCDKFPNSAGCSDLGTITNAPVVAENVTDFTAFALSPVSFVLPASACPTPLSIVMHSGGNFSLNYQVACDFVGWMRPGILAVAWFSAAMIFTGAFRANG